MTCGHILQAARNTIVNEGIRRTHDELKAWFTGPVSPHRTWQLTALSDHAPAFDHLISDPQVIERSQRLLEATRHHFQEMLTVEAFSSLPPPPPATIELLDARRAMAVDQAKADAKEEAQRTYHTALQNLQTTALEEAKRDFELWKSSTLMPEFQAKEAKAGAAAHQELSAFRHALKVESNEWKEAARLTVRQRKASLSSPNLNRAVNAKPTHRPHQPPVSHHLLRLIPRREPIPIALDPYNAG